jgi:hypothetical protein
MFDNIITTIICEYLSDEKKCELFLSFINKPIAPFSYIFKEFDYKKVVTSNNLKFIKLIYKLKNVHEIKYLWNFMNLVSVRFCNNFIDNFKKDMFPKKIAYIIFDYPYQKLITVDMIPNTVQCITFHEEYTHFDELELPKSIVIQQETKHGIIEIQEVRQRQGCYVILSFLLIIIIAMYMYLSKPTPSFFDDLKEKMISSIIGCVFIGYFFGYFTLF